MKYSKSAWFVNKFDIVVAALIVPALVVGIVFTKMAKGLAMPQLEAVGSGGWIAVLVLLARNRSTASLTGESRLQSEVLR